MIKSISIKNIALIENLYIDFYPGLNIITGETGTGKSILINAIAFILGSKITNETIRTGEKKAHVEITFDIETNKPLKQKLKKLNIDVEDNLLIIKREISNDRSRSYINLNSVPNSSLKTIGEQLIDISGQHEYQSLLRPQTHIELLDNFGQLLNKRNSNSKLFEKLKNMQNKLKEITNIELENKEKLEINTYTVEEIEKTKLIPNEDSSIEKELDTLNNFEQLNKIINESYYLIYEKENSILSISDKVIKILNDARKFDNRIEKAYKELEEGYYLIENAKDIIRDYKKISFDYSTERIEELNERLKLIQDLKRKYGNSIEEIIKHKNKCKKEIELHTGNQKTIKELKNNISSIQKELKKLTVELSKNRQLHARKLEKEIEEELFFLGMKNTNFKVEFKYVKQEDSFLKIKEQGILVRDKGIDYVEFIFSANPGEVPRPLSKIASGGELSRVTLAIKTILTEMDNINTLLFDEVDAGIGGEIANKVAKKIKDIANKRQVICITHSPQIGSQSQYHYLIDKFEEHGRTKTTIKELQYHEKVKEIARMLSGKNITELSLEHAEELINKNQQ